MKFDKTITVKKGGNIFIPKKIIKKEYVDRYAIGYKKGIEKANAQIYPQAYDEGYHVGFSEGSTEGYNTGYAAGLEANTGVQTTEPNLLGYLTAESLSSYLDLNGDNLKNYDDYLLTVEALGINDDIFPYTVECSEIDEKLVQDTVGNIKRGYQLEHVYADFDEADMHVEIRYYSPGLIKLASSQDGERWVIVDYGSVIERASGLFNDRYAVYDGKPNLYMIAGSGPNQY